MRPHSNQGRRRQLADSFLRVAEGRDQGGHGFQAFAFQLPKGRGGSQSHQVVFVPERGSQRTHMWPKVRGLETDKRERRLPSFAHLLAGQQPCPLSGGPSVHRLLGQGDRRARSEDKRREPNQEKEAARHG